MQRSELEAIRAEFASYLEKTFAMLDERGYDRGRAEAFEEVRSLMGNKKTVITGVVPAPAPVAPPKKKQKRRNSWVGLTPEQRQDRVNAIRRGKGLPPLSLRSA